MRPFIDGSAPIFPGESMNASNRMIIAMALVILLAKGSDAHAQFKEQVGNPSSAVDTFHGNDAVAVARPARLFTTAKGTRVVRSLDPGMMLYLTGNQEGQMLEVVDELGNRGWISSTLIEDSR
ncbi:MAG: hypothetical protein ACK5VV_11405 [Lysobacteraceae bacterium]|jgi:hypothetical protein|nr:hypothetical protein [Silanimonas sp.]